MLDLLAPCHRTRYIVRYAALSLLEILGFRQGANSVGKRGRRLCQFVAKYHRQMRFGVWKFLYPVLENGISRGLAVFKRPLIEFGYQLEDRDGRVKKPLSGLLDVLNADVIQSYVVEHMRLEDYFFRHVMLLFVQCLGENAVICNDRGGMAYGFSSAAINSAPLVHWPLVRGASSPSLTMMSQRNSWNDAMSASNNSSKLFKAAKTSAPCA